MTAEPRGFLESWLDLIRRRRLYGAFIFAAVMLLAAAVVFLPHPTYRAEATLRLGKPPPMTAPSPAAGLLGGLLQLGGDPFANDIEMLASRTVAEQVVLDAGLNVELKAPRGWHRDSLFGRLTTTAATDTARYEVEWLDDGRIAVERTKPDRREYGPVAPGEALEFGGVTAVFRPLRAGMPRSVRLTTVPYGEAVRNARRAIKAERTRREANFAEIRYDHTDPDVAREVVASAARRFVELRAAVDRRETSETIDSLARVATDTRSELTAAEREFAAAQRDGRVFAPEAQGEEMLQRYATLLGELETATLERLGIARLLQHADTAANPAEAWTGAAAYPALRDNSSIGQIVGQLTALQARRAQVEARRSAESRELPLIDTEMASLDSTARVVVRSYEAALDERIAALEERVAELDRGLLAFPADVIEMLRGQRSVTLLSELLALTEQRLRIEQMQQALTVSSVQTIDPPALRYKPVWPRKKLGLGIGFLLAGVFGLLGMVVVERADRAVRRADQVRARLGAPVLAAVVDRGRTIALDADSARAVLSRADDDAGRPRLVLAPVGTDSPADAVARALRETATASAHERPGAAPAPEPLVLLSPEPTGYAAATAAAAEAAPVVLVLVHGRTRLDELRRAAERLAEAEAGIAGAVIVCRRERDAEDVWR